jgi:hypothetical protein
LTDRASQPPLPHPPRPALRCRPQRQQCSALCGQRPRALALALATRCCCKGALQPEPAGPAPAARAPTLCGARPPALSWLGSLPWPACAAGSLLMLQGRSLACAAAACGLAGQRRAAPRVAAQQAASSSSAAGAPALLEHLRSRSSACAAAGSARARLQAPGQAAGQHAAWRRSKLQQGCACAAGGGSGAEAGPRARRRVGPSQESRRAGRLHERARVARRG